MSNLQEFVRKAERNAFCRICDKEIKKGESMFSLYSHRNRGIHIHICKDCVESMKEVNMDEDSNHA